MPTYKEQITRRAIAHGLGSLTNTELITVLIGGGEKLETSIHRLLRGVDFALPALARLSPTDLSRHPGIGSSRALSLASAWELARRREEASISPQAIIRSSRDAYDILRPNLMDLVHEEFWLLLLNRRHGLIVKKQVSRGGISGTVVDPKIIFKWAVEHLASAIIVAHNHPSGQLKPSGSDLKLTERLTSAGKLLEIPVLDHLILNGDGYLSLSDEQLM